MKQNSSSVNANRQSMLKFRCAPMERVRIGFIGVGARGQLAVNRMAHIEGAEVMALCDFIDDNLDASVAIVEKAGGAKPKTYLGEAGWRAMCESDSVDLVYVSTDWLSHAEIAIYAMECDKHVALVAIGGYCRAQAATLHNARELLLRRVRAGIVQYGQRGAFGRYNSCRGIIHTRPSGAHILE